MCPTPMKLPLRVDNKFTCMDINVSSLNLIRGVVNMAPVYHQFSMGHGECEQI